MASSLAAQLAQIAASSKATLDAKAQKAAHSKSLIFEPRVAASQNLATLYALCSEGFKELCMLDSRFAAFRSTLFSEQSQDEDRSQMTRAENAELDGKIDVFLRLVGSRLRLMPAIRAVEWLVRRFRIHEYNTTALLTAFLPYHTLPVFVTVLSILPAQLPHEYSFLAPYVRSLTALPRAVLVHRAIHRPEFLSHISSYTLESSRRSLQYPALLNFWSGIMVESVSGILDKSRSGRQAVQKSKDEDLLRQIGPVLSEAMVMKKVPALQIASYMIICVYVSKGDLEDGVLNALMEQLVTGWTRECLQQGLVALSFLTQYRSPKQLPRKVTKALLKLEGLDELMARLGKEHQMEKLANGLCLAAVDRLRKRGDPSGLPLVVSLVKKQVLSDQQTRVVFKSLFLAALELTDEDDAQGTLKSTLASTIVGFSQLPGHLGSVFAGAIQDTDLDIDALEMTLDSQFQIRPQALPPQPDNESQSLQAPPDPSEDFEALLARLSEDTEKSPTYLSDSPPENFSDLYTLFLSAMPDPDRLKAARNLKTLHSTRFHEHPAFMTFFIRIWSGPFPTLARVGALDLVKEQCKAKKKRHTDMQHLAPYVLVALGDPAKKVRRSAADLATVLEELHPKRQGEVQQLWGSEDLYGESSTLAAADMATDTTYKFLNGVLLPSLEECVLNADYFVQMIQSALGSSSKSSKSSAEDGARDKKGLFSSSARLAIAKLLAAHIVETPLLSVKLRLIQPLNRMKSISGTSRTELLLPFLQWWISLSGDEARIVCLAEKADEDMVNQVAVETVVANGQPGLEFMLASVQKPQLRRRTALMDAIFARIRTLWSSMKSELKGFVASTLLKLAQAHGSGDMVATEAADVLRSVELSTQILLSFLDSLQSAADLASLSPAGKRRRLSNTAERMDSPSEKKRRTGSSGHAAANSPAMSDPQAALGIALALKQVTFVLELVDSAEPAKHPHLLNPLFSTLSELQRLRSLLGSDLGYLQNLVLRSLLAMIPAYGKNKDLVVDASRGHGDLLVTCIQTSSSPAVGTTALLLTASLARIAPDAVLHSVMPIFTFMGSSVLRQSDDYSAHVIDQAIKEVVPPLIESLRKGKQNPVAGVSELVLNFVTAFEHIPSHRRLGIFVSLVETLGPNEFLFILLAMMTNMYGATGDVLAFAKDVFGSFGVDTQLQTLTRLVDVVNDLFQQRPSLSTALFGTQDGEEKDPQETALTQLDLVVHLLASKKLTAQVKKRIEKDDMDAARTRELYSNLLEQILSLASKLKKHKKLHTRCGDALPKLLNLVPEIGEFIKAVETLLDRPDPTIKRQVLRALQLRIDQEGRADSASRSSLLAFLPQLTAMIRVSDDILYKQIAVECVDKIAEKFGKQDPEAVNAAALTIASDQCLGQKNAGLREMALLCLASLIDVLQDAILPVLPVAVPRALAYLGESIESMDAKLHGATYAFMTAVTQDLPYMLSAPFLKELLIMSSRSAEAGWNGEGNLVRMQCLQAVAKRVDARVMFGGLEGVWGVTADAGLSATKEYLEILGSAIDKHPKPDIAKNVPSLSSIFLSAFDFRRSHQHQHDGQDRSHSPRSLARIEDAVNIVALKMIYKLNDASFRPIFAQLLDWAVALPKNSEDRTLRLLGVFAFLNRFFGDLKSIVTSYALYIIDICVEILTSYKNKRSKDDASPLLRELCKRVLHTLTQCFAHDKDDFWQSPAHFDLIASPLTSQLSSSPSASSTTTTAFNLTPEIITAIVGLAAHATSHEHWKTLNSALLQHLRSESPATRLAAVQCERKLTERLGEEWLDMLPEMLPYLSELQEDDDEEVERETGRWMRDVEAWVGGLEAMLQ